MSKRVVYFNGRFVPELQARVSIFDSALLFGDMAFEVTRTFAHRPFKLREHLERLFGSLHQLEVDCGLTLDQMEQLTLETLQQNVPTEAESVDWQITHNVSRGPLERFRAALPEGMQPTVLINCWPLLPQMGRFAENYETGVRLAIVDQQAMPAHLLNPNTKTRSRLHYRMAQLQAERIGEGIWPVMMDPDGFLTEGPGGNLFLVKDGTLLTPEPRNLLAGISRGTTLDLAHQLEIPIKETNLRRDEALEADEIFCTSTSYCLVHAAAIEGQPILYPTRRRSALSDTLLSREGREPQNLTLLGIGGSLGPVTAQLQDAWKKLVGLDFVAQSKGYADLLPAWESS